MGEVKTIIVTGERNPAKYPATDSKGNRLEWKEADVIEFEKITHPTEALIALIAKPFDWIIFTSQRAIGFWTELLLDHSLDFPFETKVACIGEETAGRAELDGYTPDFFPSRPGTEGFLEEFEVDSKSKWRVLIPMAESGRKQIAEVLRKRGCEVAELSLYRTSARKIAPTLSQDTINRSNLILFTSPSSFDAFKLWFQIPPSVRAAGIGKYTEEHLKLRGQPCIGTLRDAQFENIEELLC